MTNRNVLYRIFNDAGELLYVGATTNPAERLRNHHLLQPWWDDATTVTLERFDTWEELAAAEVEAIKSEGAKHNVIHSPQAIRSMRKRGTVGDGSVYQRADGMWIGAVSIQSSDGTRKRKTVSSKRREVAEQRLAELRAKHC